MAESQIWMTVPSICLQSRTEKTSPSFLPSIPRCATLSLSLFRFFPLEFLFLLTFYVYFVIACRYYWAQSHCLCHQVCLLLLPVDGVFLIGKIGYKVHVSCSFLLSLFFPIEQSPLVSGAGFPAASAMRYSGTQFCKRMFKEKKTTLQIISNTLIINVKEVGIFFCLEVVSRRSIKLWCFQILILPMMGEQRRLMAVPIIIFTAIRSLSLSPGLFCYFKNLLHACCDGRDIARDVILTLRNMPNPD